MAVYRDTATSRALTTAELFRKWVQMIHKGFTEVGLVQTSDTGQINPETVELPGTNTNAGYEVWRFNDSNQSNDPIYFKVQYGIGGASGRPRLVFTYGTGSNGSGTLTNESAAAFGSAVNTASGTPEFHICHVDGTLVFLEASVESHTQANSFFFILERKRDSKGAIITEAGKRGWYLYSTAGGGTARISTFKNGESSNMPMHTLGAGTEPSPEGRVLVGVPLPLDGNPLIGVLQGLASQFNVGDEGKVTLYGVERSYKASGGELVTRLSGMLGASGEVPSNARALLLNE